METNPLHIERIDDFTFKSKRYTLYFDKENSKLDYDQVTKLYPFVVKDNQELTDKLRLSVKRKFLPERSFYLGAVSLLKALEKGILEPLISKEAYIELCQKFEQVYGSKPEFTMRDQGTRTHPLFSAKITLKKLKKLRPQWGRTADQARAKVLKTILDPA